MTSPPLPLDRLYTLRELSEAGYGTHRTLLTYVQDGRLPAFKIAGGHYRVRERDLHRITESTTGESHVAPADELGDLVKKVVDGFPRLTEDQKSELSRLLAPPAAPAA